MVLAKVPSHLVPTSGRCSILTVWSGGRKVHPGGICLTARIAWRQLWNPGSHILLGGNRRWTLEVAQAFGSQVYSLLPAITRTSTLGCSNQQCRKVVFCGWSGRGLLRPGALHAGVGPEESTVGGPGSWQYVIGSSPGRCLHPTGARVPTGQARTGLLPRWDHPSPKEHRLATGTPGASPAPGRGLSRPSGRLVPSPPGNFGFPSPVRGAHPLNAPGTNEGGR
jgi:hypothetical protein